MSVVVTGIEKHSPAARTKIKAGDTLISINGHEIEDVLDYMFYAAEDCVELVYLHDEKQKKAVVRKSEYDDLGLQFNSFLMDEKRSCCNKCIFCFIDQMPPNMRETLYFKDDDARLSFLQGNYVTLTNLNDKDIQRIIDMRLNINVSVHTTNPELRCKMMNNRFAGEKLKYIKMMAESGLMLNCQIVCCPGINDGAELERTLNDLYALMPNIQSVAVVPVGLTKFRENLYPLELFNEKTAGDVIDRIAAVQKKSLGKYGTRMVFAADEFYLTAKRPLPDGEFYEDYPQYENGVGLCRSLMDEVDSALKTADYNGGKRKVTVACGVASAPVHTELAEKIMNRFPQIEIQIVPITNYFFGETITVTGLITAQDLISQLKDADLGDGLIISKSMLKSDEPIFLDDVYLDDVEKALNINIIPSANDGYEYLDCILGTQI
jgi:putative radical SAM enzyme (TIGR03279 family)